MTFSLVVVAVAVKMFLFEQFKSARKWPKVANWWTRAFLLNAIGYSTVYIYGTSLSGWMTTHRLWSAEDLGVVAGAVVGYLVLSFVNYWWHRLRHENRFFWRWFHQIHHSPQRIEVLTTFYKHPFEALANSFVSAPILYLGVGLELEAAAGALLLAGLVEIFYHWNIRTPYWLGFIIQRPESHCIHHQEGLHAYNYADLPLWDMLFGTFRNPRHWDAKCGMGEEAEHQLLRMLGGVDVSPSRPEKRPRRRPGRTAAWNGPGVNSITMRKQSVFAHDKDS